MNAVMKIRLSLKGKVISVMLLFAFVLSLGTVLISYSSYTRAFNEHYEELATSISRTTASVINADHARETAEAVLGVFREICAENGGLPDFDSFTPDDVEEYYARFESIMETEAYKETLKMLHEIRTDNGVKSLYLGITDTETMKDLYVVDASAPDDVCIPGDFDDVEELHFQQVLAGDFTLSAYITNYEEYGWLCTAGEPVFDDNGKVVCVAYVDISMDKIVEERQLFLNRIGIISAVAAVFTVTLVLILTDRVVLKPIKQLGIAAENYFRGKDEGEEETSEFEKLTIKTGDEIEELHQSLVQMEKDINRYISTVTTVTAEKERIGAELDVATRIQASMLPCIFPAFPERDDFEVYATMNPAKEVGGDFYDFFMVDEDNLAIVVADVSGKGVPAALFMVIGKTLIKDHTTSGKDLGEVFTEVNRLLCESNSEELFITAFVGVLNLKTGKFRYVNAGHEIPFIAKKNGKFEPYKIRAAFVLAGMDGIKYKSGEMQLEPGDKLFQYTDGVTEATDKDNRLYGMDRLHKTLGGLTDKTPTEILDGVNADINAFVGDAPQFDDITMLCLEYRGKNESSVTVDMSLDNVSKLTEFVEEYFGQKDVPFSTVVKMNVAIDELYSNIVKFSGASYAKLTCGIKNDSAYICFEDDGVEYDPLQKEDADITLSAEDREIGGLGILLVKKSMDDMQYRYEDGKNILVISKKL